MQTAVLYSTFLKLKKETTIHLKVTGSNTFTAVRTSLKDKYADGGKFAATNGAIQIQSSTAFCYYFLRNQQIVCL